jgi:hypothetical protein
MENAVAIRDAVGKDFVRSNLSPFHKAFKSEVDFGVAFFKYIKPTLQQAQVV